MKRKRPVPQPDFTRRTLLRGSALAAAAAASVAGACRAIPLSGDPDVLRVGLVGCGGRGTGAAPQAMLAEPGTVQLMAVADAFGERIPGCLEALAAELGPERADRLRVTPETTITGFDAYLKLIEVVDVVILATPPHFRPLHLAAVTAAGKHCFCEKPVAVDAPGVRSVLASARVMREKGLALASGFCWRANAGNRELYERVLSGQIGAVQAVYSTYLTGPIGPKARRDAESDLASRASASSSSTSRSTAAPSATARACGKASRSRSARATAAGRRWSRPWTQSATPAGPRPRWPAATPRLASARRRIGALDQRRPMPASSGPVRASSGADPANSKPGRSCAP